MAPCKRQIKATKHSVCDDYNNCVDFASSGCEKSWAEAQADSFSFECRGCTNMKGLEVEMDWLRQIILSLGGREEVGFASSSSGGGSMDDKVGVRQQDRC